MTWVWKGLRRARALRAITPAWCWDNLNRFDNFGSFNKAVNKIGYFSEYLRSNGGSREIPLFWIERNTAQYLRLRVPPFDSAVSVVQRLRPSDAEVRCSRCVSALARRTASPECCDQAWRGHAPPSRDQLGRRDVMPHRRAVSGGKLRGGSFREVPDQLCRGRLSIGRGYLLAGGSRRGRVVLV